LTALHGLGALTAGKILGRVGDVSRFRSAAAFASYTGSEELAMLADTCAYVISLSRINIELRAIRDESDSAS
jgi:hypothetical protein